MKKLLILLILIPQIAYASLSNCCRRFQLPGWWGSAEYLLMWRKERYYPSLVTTSPIGIPVDQAGVLGLATTSILFGNEHIGNSPQSGGRFDAGFWLTPCLGFGADWVVFGKEHISYSVDGNSMGFPIIAIPYFDVDTGAQAAGIFSYPDDFGFGKIDINTTNNIWAADLYTRWRLYNHSGLHLDFLGGFRYTRLTDSLDLSASTQDIDLLSPFFGTKFDQVDSFSAVNDFYSGLLGVIGEYRSRRWAFQMSGRFGIGNMVKKVKIEGQTIITDSAGGTIVLTRGFLTAPSNIGNHSRNQFEVVTEANAQIQVNVWANLMISAGYQVTYWPGVFLSGEQIDSNIDDTDATPNPSFPDRTSNFWAQGLTVGIYFLY